MLHFLFSFCCCCHFSWRHDFEGRLLLHVELCVCSALFRHLCLRWTSAPRLWEQSPETGQLPGVAQGAGGCLELGKQTLSIAGKHTHWIWLSCRWWEQVWPGIGRVRSRGSGGHPRAGGGDVSRKQHLIATWRPELHTGHLHTGSYSLTCPQTAHLPICVSILPPAHYPRLPPFSLASFSSSPLWGCDLSAAPTFSPGYHYWPGDKFPA